MDVKQIDTMDCVLHWSGADGLRLLHNLPKCPELPYRHISELFSKCNSRQYIPSLGLRRIVSSFRKSHVPQAWNTLGLEYFCFLRRHSNTDTISVRHLWKETSGTRQILFEYGVTLVHIFLPM